MLKSLLVKDYMTADPLSFKPGTEVLAAIHALLAHGLTGAPVVDECGCLLGFFSEKDGLKAALNASYYEQPGGPLDAYMTREVQVLEANASMADAVERFVANHYHAYPVMADGRLVGQLSRRDALKALEKLW